MKRFVWVFLLAAVSSAVFGQNDDGFTDENRPYKFAFNIEGYQHRSEEKDVGGIIMGEFGFVTGDGIYHVTVYATDKDGDFKILSMKSYYVGLPGEPTTLPPPKSSPPTPSTQRNPIIQHLEGLMGCSGCVIPPKGAPGAPAQTEPSRPAKPPARPAENQFNKLPAAVNGQGLQGSKAPTIGGKPGYNLGTSAQQPSKPPSPSRGTTPQRGPNLPISNKPSSAGGVPFSDPAVPSNRPAPGDSNSIRPESPPKTGSPISAGTPDQRDPTKYVEGLPPGMSMEDLQALLYKFNYTLRFHGHHESGYRSGDKEGGYFFNGRDGLGRDVKYVANEFGFQPNITLVELGLNSPETPKEDTEKELNELRGNEFKWFYQR